MPSWRTWRSRLPGQRSAWPSKSGLSGVLKSALPLRAGRGHGRGTAVRAAPNMDAQVGSSLAESLKRSLPPHVFTITEGHLRPQCANSNSSGFKTQDTLPTVRELRVTHPHHVCFQEPPFTREQLRTGSTEPSSEESLPRGVRVLGKREHGKTSPSSNALPQITASISPHFTSLMQLTSVW